MAIEFFPLNQLEDPELPTRVKILMTSHHINESVLAMNVGVTVGAITEFLRRPSSVSMSTFAKICGRFNLTPNQLLGNFDVSPVVAETRSTPPN